MLCVVQFLGKWVWLTAHANYHTTRSVLHSQGNGISKPYGRACIIEYVQIKICLVLQHYTNDIEAGCVYKLILLTIIILQHSTYNVSCMQ